MSYDSMISILEQLNEQQSASSDTIPHGRNLLHQLHKKEAAKEAFFERILPLYIETRTNAIIDNDLNGYVENVVEKTNQYMNCFWPPENNPFSHQTDFVSSIIPEMLCTLFKTVIESYNANLEVSAQKDLSIECTFHASSGGTINLKNKRVDVAVVKQCTLSLNDSFIDLPIPLLAIECKTNLDKNMLSGIEHSVGELKKTFPSCNYYVVTEYSDFDVNKTNYASSGINEMYILRRQKRSEVRRDNSTRKPLDNHLIYEITNDLALTIESLHAASDSLSTRMHHGRLIGREDQNGNN